ncbi:DedA family protein [Ferruginibacter sp. SUN106]|uniref:DedA family protein n=1 Tax=Ferruginibacter sp. SUN106 TaxID=2978348 RepID=UPI003D360FE4
MLDFIFLDFHWHQLLQPQWYILNGGLWFVLLVVFAETGLFAGFFLPGDSLLFVAGLSAHEIKMDNKTEPGLGYQFLHLFGMDNNHSYWLDLFVLVILISLAGILGNALGYWFGKKFGHGMYNWRDRWFFKKRYLHEAHDFYEKHGGGAIVLARFVPIVRTFAPLIAGIVNMDKAKFSFYNIIGCVAWVTSMILGGFFLQKWLWDAFQFDLKEHLEIIVIGIVVVTTAPIFIKLFFGKKKKYNDDAAAK